MFVDTMLPISMALALDHWVMRFNYPNAVLKCMRKHICICIWRNVVQHLHCTKCTSTWRTMNVVNRRLKGDNMTKKTLDNNPLTTPGGSSQMPPVKRPCQMPHLLIHPVKSPRLNAP